MNLSKVFYHLDMNSILDCLHYTDHRQRLLFLREYRRLLLHFYRTAQHINATISQSVPEQIPLSLYPKATQSKAQSRAQKGEAYTKCNSFFFFFFFTSANSILAEEDLFALAVTDLLSTWCQRL